MHCRLPRYTLCARKAHFSQACAMKGFGVGVGGGGGGRGGRYIDERLSKADKSVFLKLSAIYRYRKMKILKLLKNYRYRKMH